MNEEMIEAYAPRLKALVARGMALGNSYDDGLGIRMGESVGGVAEHMEGAFFTSPFYPPGDALKGIIVNKLGAALRQRGRLPLPLRGGAVRAARRGGLPHPRLRDDVRAGVRLPPARRRLGDRRGDGGRARDAAGLAGRRRWRDYNKHAARRRGPGVPQGGRVARCRSTRVRGVPTTSRRARRSTPASPSAGCGSRSTARCCRRPATPGPRRVRRRRLRVEHRARRVGVLQRHPARRGVVLRPSGRPPRRPALVTPGGSRRRRRRGTACPRRRTSGARPGPGRRAASLWQWSIQMPGLSARKAISYSSPDPTSRESTHHGLPVAGLAVAAQHDGVVAVQVHRVGSAAAVLELHHDHVALLHDVHRDVREEMAVDRPPQAGPAVEEAGAAPDAVLEGAVGVVGRRSRCRPARRTPAGRACRPVLRGVRRLRALGADHDLTEAADLHADRGAVVGHRHLEVDAAARARRR